MDKEVWKDIIEYPGYQVSNYGRIRSFDGEIKTLSSNGNGYLVIYNKGKKYYIHRLVAEYFLPNHDNLPIVNHKDECRSNNRVDNLEWCNTKYNIRYSIAKKINQYTIEGKFIRTWDAMMDIVRELGYNKSIISKCCLHKPKNKSAYGFKWYFDDDPLQTEPPLF